MYSAELDKAISIRISITVYRIGIWKNIILHTGMSTNRCVRNDLWNLSKSVLLIYKSRTTNKIVFSNLKICLDLWLLIFTIIQTLLICLMFLTRNKIKNMLPHIMGLVAKLFFRWSWKLQRWYQTVSMNDCSLILSNGYLSLQLEHLFYSIEWGLVKYWRTRKEEYDIASNFFDVMV